MKSGMPLCQISSLEEMDGSLTGWSDDTAIEMSLRNSSSKWDVSLFISDGAGRSGVYLAIDANIELSEEDGVFDVYGYLKKMRQQRRGLVESLVSDQVQALAGGSWGNTSSVKMTRTTA